MSATSPPERFWAKVDKGGECWVWTASVNNHGYGQFTHKGRPVKAHRFSWFLAHGEWPTQQVLHHCDNPPCVACCPTGASHVAEPGRVVLVTPERCIGCKACIAACPYDARFVHPEGYVDKCTFCHHRTKDGGQPACVSVCPTRCMTFGDLDDAASVVSELLRTRAHHTLLPEAGTRSRIFYLT